MSLAPSREIELISMHIPKTAGTSFRNLLESVYGRSQVVRFDMHGGGELFANGRPFRGEQPPARRVLHGHFRYHKLLRRFSSIEQVRIISWVRDPVRRVVSNYHYLCGQLDAAMKSNTKHDPRGRVLRSLIEFARDPRNCDRQFRYFRDCSPEDFAFIGIQEFYDEEVAEVARILGWEKCPPVPRRNITKGKSEEHPQEWLEEIAELNARDMALYASCLRLREARLQARPAP